MSHAYEIIERAVAGRRPAAEEARALAGFTDLPALTAAAARLRDAGFGGTVTYSRKVFIPLTQLCRDVCHYCTFAHPPRKGERAYLTPDEVLDVARRGREAGCREALFTLGDKPERRYRVAAEELAALGHETTLQYLEAMAELVFRETGLLPHLNPGLMTAEEVARLRRVSVSQGIMLETSAERLSMRGGPHFGSPDKLPVQRLATIGEAGRQQVPFTSGLLIGIGETRAERIDTLLDLRDQHDRHGHIQEVIVQNFRAKPGTRMADAAEPDLDDHLWTIAMARLILGTAISVQAPPNLAQGALARREAVVGHGGAGGDGDREGDERDRRTGGPHGSSLHPAHGRRGPRPPPRRVPVNRVKCAEITKWYPPRRCHAAPSTSSPAPPTGRSSWPPSVSRSSRRCAASPRARSGRSPRRSTGRRTRPTRTSGSC